MAVVRARAASEMVFTLPIVGLCEDGSSVAVGDSDIGAAVVGDSDIGTAVGARETGAAVVGAAVWGADVVGRSVSTARTGTSKNTAETGPS